MCSSYKLFLIYLYCLISINISFSQDKKWNKLTYPQGIRIEQIAFNSKDDIFISTWWHPDSMVLDGNIDRIERSTNHGITWETVFNAGWQPLTMTIDSLDNVYSGRFGIAFKSLDNGVTWDTLANTILAGIFVNNISISPQNHIYISPGTFRSTDNGKHWDKLSLQKQSTDFLFLQNGTILAGVITDFYPVPRWSIYRSNDDGNSWDSVFTSDNSIEWSLVSAQNGYVFAATIGLDSSSGGIYRSIDNGVSWSSVNSGLPSRKVNGLTVSSTGILFTAIKGKGIFQSVDNGNSWTDFTNGLEDLRIHCIGINSNDQLYVGTGTDSLPTPNTIKGSIYVCSDITDVNHHVSTVLPKMKLFQNYPNPFNSMTNISFELKTESFVSLKIFDILGREVAILVSEKLKPGNYNRQWNAEDFPSGLYFYRMEADNKIQTKNLILLK